MDDYLDHVHEPDADIVCDLREPEDRELLLDHLAEIEDKIERARANLS